MTTAFTILPEQARESMRKILEVPAAHHVVIIDAIGLCLAHVGHEPVSNQLLSDWTIVARAAFGSCDQFGQRSGVGACVETMQEHQGGGVLMRVVAGGMLLVVQHGPSCPRAHLQEVTKEVAGLLPMAVTVKPSAPLARQRNIRLDDTQDLTARSHHSDPLIQEAEVLSVHH